MSVTVITADNFEKEILKAEKPVLVDFWAPWCAPCKMIASALTQLSEKYAGELLVAKVNVDEVASVASKFSVISIPTLMIFKNGEVVDQRVGAASLSVIEGFVKQNL